MAPTSSLPVPPHHGHSAPLSPPPTPGDFSHSDTMSGGHMSNGNGDYHMPTVDECPEERACHQQQPTNGTNGENGFHSNDDDEFRLHHRHSHPIPPLGIHEQESGNGPSGHSRAKIRSYASDENRKAFPRISKPVELMRNSYDCVVIGSGYGGGIAASRMARTGQSVCLLERGSEKWPGEYPTGAAEAFKELHYSGSFAPFCLDGKLVDGGNPTGMYHLIFGKGQNAVVANGLGGTSLINANVFMPADRQTLAMKMWPPEIRNNVQDFEDYYTKVETVLEPKEYPEDWPKLPKLELLKKQAEHLGLGHKFKKVRQTTRFKNGPNHMGVEMSPSAMTGQDCTGVNDGSKTTTLVTYLADAWNWGAEMFCECEARFVEKAQDREGYIIYFAWHGRNRGHFKANLHGDLMWVHAKKAVFLGAGALGTTEILLRSKAMGLSMSNQVGTNMSGNGDILAFGYNTDETANAMGRAFPSPYNPVGPTINGVIDCREGHDNPLDGFVIEDGAVPQALAGFLQTIMDFMPGSIKPKGEGLVERTRAALARYGSRFLGPYLKSGALEKTQIYLIMSHDSNQAVLTLKDDKPVLEFLGVGRSAHVKHLNEVLARATQAVGGTLVQNPFFALMGEQQVTVHPIGGAHMARDNTGATGVTNHAGEVLTGNGPETHDGLIVTDASLIPVALGANPFATIAALAERSVELYAHKHGLSISQERNDILDLFGEPAHLPQRHNTSSQQQPSTLDVDVQEEVLSLNGAADVIVKADAIQASGFGFTEVMSGFVHYDTGMVADERATYELAARTAKSLCESARFFLSMQAFNATNMLKSSQHRGLLTGTFVCPTIPGSPFMVQRGEFNLFILDHKAPGTRNLTYDFDMRGVNGKKLHFHGYKVVDSSVALAPLSLWRSTTTLYVTVSEHVPGMCDDLDDEDAWRRGRVLAKGIMQIQPKDFVSELLTMTPTGSGLLKRAMSAASFLTFFTRKSLSLFLAPLTPLQYPSQTYSGYINNTPPTDSIAIYARDGVCTRMHVWEPTSYPNNDPAAVKTLFMIPGASVDHQIYALPTIPFNAVNYFTRAGYRVYVSVHRIGQLMVAENMWTTYDARLDLRACLEYIRLQHQQQQHGNGNEQQKIYTIAHCMGSVAFAAGLLDGTIPADWILGITCSQVFMNPIWQTLNMMKVMAGPIPLDKLYARLAGTWFSCSTSRDDTLVQKFINQLLRFYPDERRELCNSAACHRTSFVSTGFFGGVNTRLLGLLMRQGFEGRVMGNAPLYDDLTTKENVARLRGVPVMLFVGGDNAVLSPESTSRTYEILCDAFGGEGGGEGVDYRRKVVPGYGHLDCWMGRNAWKDVYPFVREEVDRVCRGETYKFVEPDDKFKRAVETGELLY
ncbi:hypothetical protein GE09DRAFT_1060862 [Coniochaeta sp. 2T2.1]|nr:hypothetical protein GE09DRAFT_1060862 [Coniochaeta sp. 2T2.1]